MNTHNTFAGSSSLRIGRSMFGLLLAGLMASATATAAEGPSTHHTFFMRGQIVEAQDASVVICIGRADGAAVGQELDVVHHSRVTSGPKGMGRFERSVVGKVRIDAIVDEHYAEATVVSGKAAEHDSVELETTRE